MPTSSETAGNGVRMERWNATIAATERIIQSRFTGWICLAIIFSYLAVLVGAAFRICEPATEAHGEFARLAFVTYVVKRLAQGDGRAAETKSGGE